jgi:hypothetical protein
VKPKQAGRRYRVGGYDSIWKWITGKPGQGISRTRAAEEWAKRRGKKAKPGQRHPFRKVARIYGHRLHHLIVKRNHRASHHGHDAITMYDSVEAAALPANAAAALFYADGPFANEAAVKAQTRNAKHTGITVNGGTHHIKGCDCEPGDLTPSQAADWCKVELAAGRRPGPYMSISTVPTFLNELASRGHHLGQVDIFSAHYIGPHICDEHCWSGLPPGFEATGTQHTGSMVATHPDISLVEKRFFA